MATKLQEYIDGTAQNARETLTRYPAHAALFQRINDAFQRLVEVLTSSPEAVVIFVPMAHADFLAAARLALGGELPASFGAARVCVEDALYGFLLHHDPALKEVWVGRHEDEASRKLVRRKLTYGAMIAALTRTDQAIATQADFAYQTSIDLGAHPNIMKLFVNLADEGATPVWRYINLQAADVSIAMRVVSMNAIAALNIFKLIWPITFSSADVNVIVTEVHDMLLALPSNLTAA